MRRFARVLAAAALGALTAGGASAASLPPGLADDLVALGTPYLKGGGHDCRLAYYTVEGGRLIALMRRDDGDPRTLARALVARSAPYLGRVDRDAIADAMIVQGADAESSDHPWGGPIAPNPAVAQRLAVAATRIGRLDVPATLAALRRVRRDDRTCPRELRAP